VKSFHHLVDNGRGFRLAVHQTYQPDKLVRSRMPVLIVPGYGMNSFIFSFHPSGLSLEGFLADAGFEVWRADLRGQGESITTTGSDDYSLEDLAVTDLGAVLDKVRESTATESKHTTVVGCSLGGTLMFLHAALKRDHSIGAMVSMGSPVRWVKVHPLAKIAFASPRLVGMLPVKGTRRLAELALPLLAAHTPWVLSAYMNPEITDTSAARHFARTVEDPNRSINREIARWIGARDLTVRGVNLSDALRRMEMPLLCVYANNDGIVPEETATFPYHQVGSAKRALLAVGTREIAMAHADMFISNEAHLRVFTPLAEWLSDLG
jgi:pimeloyl-ACP methyl ester carboxylesterase